MKIKKGFELRNVCGENVIIAQGIENLDFSKMVNLNETASFLWDAAIGKEFEAEELAEMLCQEYEVEKDRAMKDVEHLLNEWKELGLLEA
ncbi:MAG: PqqD family protein [Bacteroidaceae bacterium]|nr:PqqD family protein [Bacteroidaceae bacterium]MBR2863844.1 PqqD family protein [Bacteroidaceae bacterium]